MTDTLDTCRNGLRVYRNGREWCNYERDEATRQTNERANVEAKAPTSDAGASLVLSFVMAVSETEAYTMSQESRTPPNEDSNTQCGFQGSNSLIEELADYILQTNRLVNKQVTCQDLLAYFPTNLYNNKL
ncbi:hypothetical protein K469DRAFT_692066 [Zopfia rhizophila CBS 207.26]|uniref:Uncharacterized protein n=1 Tax=Zopfia rhizophila CBS 207.26 TaxID=1314779 RepID=A0A6A6DV98_9PEZI|nr:hypothetical protein K469DRAFT_692066 [Zopfia rhizophila CBS 207.26]